MLRGSRLVAKMVRAAQQSSSRSANRALAGDAAAGGVGGLKYQLDARNYKYVQHKNKFGKDYALNGDIY